jgi:hypothetical protein
LDAYRKALAPKVGAYRHALATAAEERQALTAAEGRYAAALAAQRLAQAVAERVQQTAHAQIQAVVTRCLEAVFDNKYEFSIKFARKRGRTEAALTLSLDGNELDDPTDQTSGGVIDVAAFALRLACLVLARPRRRRLLVLDEPFRFVHSTAYRVRVRKLLEALSTELDVQIVMATGMKELRAGKVIDLGEADGDF